MNVPFRFGTDPSCPRAVFSLRKATAILALALVSQASAATLVFEDNFDSYPDQPSFEAVWEVLSPATSGTLTADESVSPTKSINFGTTAQRNQAIFEETGESGYLETDTVIRFSLDFFDSNAAAAPYRQFHNLQDSTAATASGQLIALGLNNNLTSSGEEGNFYMARILGFNGNAFFKLNDDPLLLRTTGWHNLAVEISYDAFHFFVDGSLAETVPHDGITRRSYDVVRLGSGLTSVNGTNIDNVKVELVPEPSSLLLLLGAGVAVVGVRRRSHR
jgi:hypothetical protein